jgi:hypothetical protein
MNEEQLLETTIQYINALNESGILTDDEVNTIIESEELTLEDLETFVSEMENFSMTEDDLIQESLNYIEQLAESEIISESELNEIMDDESITIQDLQEFVIEMRHLSEKTNFKKAAKKAGGILSKFAKSNKNTIASAAQGYAIGTALKGGISKDIKKVKKAAKPTLTNTGLGILGAIGGRSKDKKDATYRKMQADMRKEDLKDTAKTIAKPAGAAAAGLAVGAGAVAAKKLLKKNPCKGLEGEALEKCKKENK